MSVIHFLDYRSSKVDVKIRLKGEKFSLPRHSSNIDSKFGQFLILCQTADRISRSISRRNFIYEKSEIFTLILWMEIEIEIRSMMERSLNLVEIWSISILNSTSTLWLSSSPLSGFRIHLSFESRVYFFLILRTSLEYNWTRSTSAHWVPRKYSPYHFRCLTLCVHVDRLNIFSVAIFLIAVNDLLTFPKIDGQAIHFQKFSEFWAVSSPRPYRPHWLREE